jgi:hypothetical protein
MHFTYCPALPCPVLRRTGPRKHSSASLCRSKAPSLQGRHLGMRSPASDPNLSERSMTPSLHRAVAMMQSPAHDESPIFRAQGSTTAQPTPWRCGLLKRFTPTSTAQDARQGFGPYGCCLWSRGPRVLGCRSQPEASQASRRVMINVMPGSAN